MSATLLVATALMAQSAATLPVTDAAPDRVEVGYEELAAGRPDAAIARILSGSDAAPDDPAALINLGTAYARIGQARKAHGYYMAAIASRSRYDLELADGSWMDSRRAARLAAEKLAGGQALALR